MKIRRRTALKAAAAGALTLALWEGAAPVTAADSRGSAVVRPSNHGLPPAQRLEELWCAECGQSIGLHMVDESDAWPELVCDPCYRDVQDHDEQDDYDYEEVARERDDLQRRAGRARERVVLTMRNPPYRNQKRSRG